MYTRSRKSHSMDDGRGLPDVAAEKSDPFLIEAKIKVWKRTKEFYVTSNLHDLFAVPLLHACSAEDPPTPACSFMTGDVECNWKEYKSRTNSHAVIAKNKSERLLMLPLLFLLNC